MASSSDKPTLERLKERKLVRDGAILIGLLEQFSDYLETEGIDTSHLVLNPGAIRLRLAS